MNSVVAAQPEPLAELPGVACQLYVHGYPGEIALDRLELGQRALVRCRGEASCAPRAARFMWWRRASSPQRADRQREDALGESEWPWARVEHCAGEEALAGSRSHSRCLASSPRVGAAEDLISIATTSSPESSH